jgi:glycosyltransferase involved in cell wall biosynthesis
MVAVHLRSRVMRVLIVLSTDARRGAEIEGQSLATELSAAGVTTTVVSLAAEAVGAVRLDATVLGRTRLGVATLRALRARARDHDVVVAYGSSTLQACALALLGARTPFVYRSIGDPGEWVRDRRHATRTAWFMRRAARVVALWDGAAQSIVELYGLPAERVVVIPNARSHQEFLPPTPDERRAARRRFGVTGAESLVVVVGALSDEKRVDLAVHAVARVPDGRLLVVGDGPRRGEEAVGRGDDVVAGADAERHHRGELRVGAGGHPDRVPDADVRGDGLLERLDPGAEDEVLAFEDLVRDAADLVAEGGVLELEVEERDRHGGRCGVDHDRGIYTSSFSLSSRLMYA